MCTRRTIETFAGVLALDLRLGLSRPWAP